MLTQGGQPRAAGPGEVQGGPRVVRRRGAAGRGDAGLDGAQALLDGEVGAVQVGDGGVHHLLQPLAHGFFPVDGGAALGQVVHGLQRGGAGQHPLGLGGHLALQALHLGEAVGVRVVQVEVRTGGGAGRDGVPLGAHGIGGALGAGGVAGQERAGLAQRTARRRGAGVQVGAQGVRAGLGQGGEPAGPAIAGPAGQLLGHRGRLERRREQPAPRALLQGGGPPGQAARQGSHPAGQRGPVLLGGRGHHRERRAHLVHRRADVAHRPQVLARRGGGQGGGQPLAQQPGAAALVAVSLGGLGGPGTVTAILAATLRHGGVQVGQGGPGQVVQRRPPVGGEVGQAVLVGHRAQRGGGQRVQVHQGVDVGVGDGAGRGGGGHPPIIAVGRARADPPPPMPSPSRRPARRHLRVTSASRRGNTAGTPFSQPAGPRSEPRRRHDEHRATPVSTE